MGDGLLIAKDDVRCPESTNWRINSPACYTSNSSSSLTILLDSTYLDITFMLFRMQPCITIKLISRQSLIGTSYGLVILDLRPGCLAGNLIIADKH